MRRCATIGFVVPVGFRAVRAQPLQMPSGLFPRTPLFRSCIVISGYSRYRVAPIPRCAGLQAAHGGGALIGIPARLSRIHPLGRSPGHPRCCSDGNVRLGSLGLIRGTHRWLADARGCFSPSAPFRMLRLATGLTMFGARFPSRSGFRQGN